MPNYCWIVFSCRMVCPATLKICHEKGLHFTCKMIYLDCCSFSNQGYTKLDILAYLHVIFHLPSCTCHPFFKFSLHPSHKRTHIDWLHDSPVQQLERPGTKEIKVVDIDQFGMSTDLPSIEGIYMRRCLRNAASII